MHSGLEAFALLLHICDMGTELAATHKGPGPTPDT